MMFHVGAIDLTMFLGSLPSHLPYSILASFLANSTPHNLRSRVICGSQPGES